MAENSNAAASKKESKSGFARFLGMRAIWKLSVIELSIYLIIGIVMLVKLLLSA